MAMISIGGREIASPATYKVDSFVLGNFERNANGKLVGDVIAKKAKLNCTWVAVPNDELEALRSAISPYFINVKYMDNDGSEVTREMYPGDLSTELVSMHNKILRWNVTLNFIER